MTSGGGDRRTVRLAAALALACLALTSGMAVVPAGAGAAAPGGLIAPPSVCPHQSSPGEPAAVQERAMLCMVNFARARSDAAPLQGVAKLNRAAARKSLDMIRCDEFSHEACGRDFTHWIERFGYRACNAGENIAWGTGSLGSVRSIFTSWIRSAGHRRNILSSDFDDIGIGLRIGTLEEFRGAHVWTQQFGGRC